MADEPSRDTLEEVPDRAGKFLRTTSQNPEILAVLGTRGYVQAIHEQGWTLYLTASNAPVAGVAPSEPSPAARAAIALLSREDGALFAFVHAALDAEFGAQAAYVTDGLKDAEGAVAVANVATVLARIGELAVGRDDASRAADQAAVAALDTVKLDAAERARLAKLVADAQSWDPIAVATVPVSAAARFEARKASLVALRNWYRTWSTVASALITRRDWLIGLGLAKRKKKEKPA